jgi:site-specific DNA recombinase
VIRADGLEAAVWGKVTALLSDPEMLAGEMLAMQGNGDLEKEIGRLEKSLQTLEKGREAILDALAAGLVELDAKTRAKLADLKNRKERLLARKRELEAAARGAREAAARFDELRALAGEALGKLDEPSHEEKRALVRELVGQVMVSGSGRNFFATVYLKAPAADLAFIPAGIRN